MFYLAAGGSWRRASSSCDRDDRDSALAVAASAEARPMTPGSPTDSPATSGAASAGAAPATPGAACAGAATPEAATPAASENIFDSDLSPSRLHPEVQGERLSDLCPCYAGLRPEIQGDLFVLDQHFIGLRQLVRKMIGKYGSSSEDEAVKNHLLMAHENIQLKLIMFQSRAAGYPSDATPDWDALMALDDVPEVLEASGDVPDVLEASGDVPEVLDASASGDGPDVLDASGDVVPDVLDASAVPHGMEVVSVSSGDTQFYPIPGEDNLP